MDEMDSCCEKGANRDKTCEALSDYCWAEDMEEEEWWNDQCSLCGHHMGNPLPERCGWCGAKVVE